MSLAHTETGELSLYALAKSAVAVIQLCYSPSRGEGGMVDVSRWLADQGLGHHAEAFAENGIAGDVLRELTDADLKELGLNLGDRKRLLKAIATLDAAPTQDRDEPAEQTTAPAVPREAERRQLTVMFVDLVGSTELSGQLDPEDLREVLRAYQQTCADVASRFEGHVAKYIGDGLLVYFGYPQAHEDDARRAVSAGLGIVEGIGALNRELVGSHGVELGIRVGIHTGLVVAGEMGGGETRDADAIVGETPNIAARLEGLATPNTVVMSAATHRLVEGLFDPPEWPAQGPPVDHIP
jgi:class 3 adenylate cyclase